MTDPEQVTVSPAGEVVSPSPQAENVTALETPAVSQEDQDIAAAHAAVDSAKTPEEKEQARQGYQRRIDAKERRLEKERLHKLEIENAELRGRSAVLEQLGRQPQQPTAQELQTPAPQLPPKPDKAQFMRKPDEWSDPELDQEAYLEAVADWKADCKWKEFQHQQQVQQEQSARQTAMERGQSFMQRVTQKHPDFADLTRPGMPGPNETVGRLLVRLDSQNRETAEKVAYFLAKNPGELARLNQLGVEDAAYNMGELAFKLSLPPVQPNKVSAAPPPVQPVTNAETVDVYDPQNPNMDAYGRHHPATSGLSWLR